MSHQRSFMSVQTFHTHAHTKIYESQLEIIIPGGIPTDLFDICLTYPPFIKTATELWMANACKFNNII